MYISYKERFQDDGVSSRVQRKWLETRFYQEQENKQKNKGKDNDRQ